jgi:hypothetical protein
MFEEDGLFVVSAQTIDDSLGPFDNRGLDITYAPHVYSSISGARSWHGAGNGI